MPSPITCILTGMQRGWERFPNNQPRPRVKPWRCDLTALSQLYNLYFLACNDTIHIYLPGFPDQRLSDEPELILHPPVSPEVGNGIDPLDTHSITRIHVGYLGHEEILLATCDDGDVVGYRTQEIQRAIDRRTTTEHVAREPVTEETIRVFLHRNVGASAWGLAVHREARMIAISANTHEITVLAYALTHPEVDSGDFTLSTSEPVSDFPAPRHGDQVITLTTTSNIPAVSFINNGDDPHGRWLLCSLIDGNTLIWDLHHFQEPGRVISLGWCASTPASSEAPELDPGQCACIDHNIYPHGNWGAMMLDTRSVYEISTYKMTPEEISILEPENITGTRIRNITRSKESFMVTMKSPPSSVAGQSLSNDDGPDGTMVQEQDMEVSASNLEDGQNEMIISDSSSDEYSDVAVNAEQAMEDQDSSNIQITEATSQDTEMQSDSSSDTDGQLQAEQPNLEVLQSDEAFASANGIPQKRPYCDDIWIGAPPPSSAKCPSGPFLILTKEEVFLIQRPFRVTKSESTDPIIAMRRPLHPDPWEPFLGSGDRLCYSSQIPELGVFVVASPCGRVAIFSIYWTKTKHNAVPEYGFRLEYLLRFEKRWEHDSSDYGASLAGVAVGPVQGMFDVPEDVEGRMSGQGLQQSRRWRLLLFFTSHTVLSFEIAKRKVDDSPTLSELVV